MKTAIQLTGACLLFGLQIAAEAQQKSDQFTVLKSVQAVDEEGNPVRTIRAGDIVKRLSAKGNLTKVEQSGLAVRAKTLYVPTELLKPTSVRDIEARVPELKKLAAKAKELNEQSIARMRTAEWTQALELNEQAYELVASLAGELNPYAITLLEQSAYMAANGGDLEKSRRYAETACQDRQTVHGQQSMEAAAAINVLGLIEMRLENFDQGESLIKEAIEIFEKQEGPRSIATLDCRCDLGLVYFERGKLDDAFAVFQDVLAIAAKDFPSDEVTQICLYNLAALYGERSEYRLARSNFDKAFAMEATNAKKFGKSKPVSGLMESMDRIVGVLVNLGEFELAQVISKASLDSRKKLYGETHFTVARDYQRLGLISEMFMDVPKAFSFYNQAIQIYDKNYGPDNLQSAKVYGQLGILNSKAGNYPSAKNFHAKSLKTLEAKTGKTNPGLAAPLTALGLAHLGLKEQSQAVEVLNRSLAISRSGFGDQHPQTIETLRMLGIAHGVGGSLDRTLQYIDEARRNEHEFIWSTLPYLDRNQQDVYFQEHSRGYMELDLGLVEHADKHPLLVEKTLEWLLNYKSVATEIRGMQQQLLNQASGSEHQSELDELIKLRQAMGKIQLNDSGSVSNQQYFKMRELERKLVERITAETDFSASAPAWLSVAEFRKAIPKDGVYVEIAKYIEQPLDGKLPRRPAAHYGMWIVWPDEKKPVEFVKIPFCSVFDRELAQVLQMIRSGGGPDAESGLKIRLNRFYENNFASCFDKVTAAKQVIICPDATTWVVPWPALMTGREKFLIERHALTFCLSGRDLKRGRPLTAGWRKPVIVADPSYDHAFFSADRTRQVMLENLQANRLPGTRLEAKLVAASVKKYTGQEPLIVLDTDANESKIKTLVSPRILTFATHGFFAASEPVVSGFESLSSFQSKRQLRVGNEDPLTKCGLMLAGCNRGWSGQDKSPLNDGVLTGLEALNLNLTDTEMVVLSACETGLGKVTAGEGIAGLRQAFHIAGAKSVVASLWPVPDKETVFLMAIFYDGLAAKKTKAEALRSAQGALIDAFRAKDQFPHPALWAAFTVTETGLPPKD